MKKKKIYILTIASSCEYGCTIDRVATFDKLADARKEMRLKYKEVKGTFETCDASSNKDSFSVADYDCHYDCVTGQISMVEVLN